MFPNQSQTIQSQSSVSDSPKTTESTHTDILNNIMVWLSKISDVIWAAIIASGLTYIGVLLTNRGNRKCLLLQLDHAAKQKDKEREIEIRKETYIEAVEAIADTIKDIERLPNNIIHSNNAEIGNKLLSTLAKVHMVSTFDTIKAVCEFMKIFNQRTFPIIPEVNKFITLKQKVASLNSTSEYQVKSLEEIDSKFEKMDSEGNRNPTVLDNYKKMFEDMKARHDSTVTLLAQKQAETEELANKFVIYVSSGGCLSSERISQRYALDS